MNTKLHLGCGKRNFGSQWNHIDQIDAPHIVSHDVTRLPYADNSIELIYCSHLISYFMPEDMPSILKEWYRVLKPGGILRIATPDYAKLFEAYKKRGDIACVLGPLYGKMDNATHQPQIQELLSDYPPGIIHHKTCYDYHSLTNLLRENGFTDWEQYDHRTTEHGNTGERTDMYDDHSAAYIDGILISLNVECYKPA